MSALQGCLEGQIGTTIKFMFLIHSVILDKTTIENQ